MAAALIYLSRSLVDGGLVSVQHRSEYISISVQNPQCWTDMDSTMGLRISITKPHLAIVWRAWTLDKTLGLLKQAQMWRLYTKPLDIWLSLRNAFYMQSNPFFFMCTFSAYVGSNSPQKAHFQTSLLFSPSSAFAAYCESVQALPLLLERISTKTLGYFMSQDCTHQSSAYKQACIIVYHGHTETSI